MAEPEPVWCVVANVRPEAWGDGSSPGTKHFRAGALIWVVNGYWGMNDRVNVIGRHRVSARWIAVVEETARLTNFRVKPAFHPRLRRRLEGHVRGRAWPTKAQCEAAAANLAALHAPMPDLRDEIERHRQALRLLDHDARGRTLDAEATAALGRWTPQLRNLDRTPPPEVQVLADWLEEQGTPITLHELVRTLDRRRAP